MTRTYRFVQVDVFTDRPFGGNPLAVFPEAGRLSEQEMQRLALEMNLSETTFVLPPRSSGADFRVRIFTPRSELPFAGHPVIGTSWVLADLQKIALTPPVTTVHLELGVGVLPADLHVADGRATYVTMTQGEPSFHTVIENVTDLAAGLGVSPSAITDAGYPSQVVSTGMPQLMVPIASLADIEALSPAAMDTRRLAEVCESVDTRFILAFCTETVDPKASVHVRGLGHPLGIPEDPATGSANGALGAYLVHHRVVPFKEGTVTIRSEQGLEMGRPSRLDIEVDHTEGEPQTVRVSGSVTPIIEGTVRF